MTAALFSSIEKTERPQSGCLFYAFEMLIFFPFCCTWKPLTPLITMLTFSQSMEDNIFISCSFESMRYPGLQKNKMDKQTLI